MPNLKEIKGTFKGVIGECIFKSTRKYVVLPKFFDKSKYSSIFGKYLKVKQINFILENWHSIDSVEISFENGKKEVRLYEIKTKNIYKKTNFGYKPKMTLKTHLLYEEAKKIGFSVKLATVELYENWNFKIIIEDLSKDKYCIDKPKTYDSKPKSRVRAGHFV